MISNKNFFLFKRKEDYNNINQNFGILLLLLSSPTLKVFGKNKNNDVDHRLVRQITEVQAEQRE